MTITRKGEYWVDYSDREGLSIGIESGRVAECVAEANRRGAVGVFGSPYHNFKEDNLDFLRDLRDVSRIWFWDVKLKNVDGIYALRNLRDFGVHPKRPGIDFSRLPTLETVVWYYNPRDKGLASLKRIRLLGIWHYNPKQRSFEGLDLPSGIEELGVCWANPESLVGLPKLQNVKRVNIAYCRNLKTIGELPRIAPNVEHLVVEACGRVSDGKEIVRRLPKLAHAYVRDAVLVSRGSRQNSV